MKKSLKQKGTVLFAVVLLFMTVMLVPAVSAREQDDTTRAKVPSCIKVYSLVELNPTEILERINAGESVNISICGEPFELKLVPSNIRSPDCKAFISDDDGTYEVELPEPATYKGKVVGDSDSRVRATITPDWISGFVICDKGYYWIDSLNGYKKAEAGANITHYTYNTADTEFEIYFGDNVLLEIPGDDSISDISTIVPSNFSVSSIANFEKTPKTARYASKAYNEWDGKRSKSKYYIEREGNKAKVEVPSNFRVYSIEQGETATVKKPSNFRVYATKYDTPQRGKAEINPAEIKESINASFTICFKGTEQKFGHKIYFKDGEEVHEIVPYVPSTSIKVIGDSIDDFPASITLDKVGNVPDIFVEITESDLDKYPLLRNILEELERWEGARGINYKTGEIKGNEIVDLVQCKYAKKYDTPQWGYYIKYKEDFYSIWLMILLVSAGEGR